MTLQNELHIFGEAFWHDKVPGQDGTLLILYEKQFVQKSKSFTRPKLETTINVLQQLSECRVMVPAALKFDILANVNMH